MNSRKETIELFGPNHPLPVAIKEAVDSAVVNVSSMPPPTARNFGQAFGLDPIDEVRLGEALASLNALGFIVQRVDIERSVNEWAMVKIMFGQITDPRFPHTNA